MSTSAGKAYVALYVRNRIWQRPRDISLDITNLLQQQAWGPHIDQPDWRGCLSSCWADPDRA